MARPEGARAAERQVAGAAPALAWPPGAGSRGGPGLPLPLPPPPAAEPGRSGRRGAGGGAGAAGGGAGAAGRLSVGPGSGRRKELKGVFLPSNGPGGAAQQLCDGGGGSLAGLRRRREPEPEGSPEVLSLALDPLEHEWLLTVAQGDSESILRLLDLDPSLLTRKDFVTGFTALHWLAKHGHHESLITVISHAQKKGYPVNVNVAAASGGLTPLHLAALQGHEMLIKVLVGAYGADASRRDHSGRKAWQYLRADASWELKELAGALEEDLAQLGAHNTNNNCKSSREARAGAGDCVDSGAEGKKQRSRSLSTLRDFVRQAFAFFQER